MFLLDTADSTDPSNEWLKVQFKGGFLELLETDPVCKAAGILVAGWLPTTSGVGVAQKRNHFQEVFFQDLCVFHKPKPTNKILGPRSP